MEKNKEGEPQANKKRKVNEEHIEPTEEVKTIELTQEHVPKKQKIGTLLDPQLEKTLIAFLQENINVFAWDAADMCGIDLKVIVHRLNVNLKIRPVKQKKRAFGNERIKAIKEEVEKLLRTDYIRPVQYPEWLANVVLVPKPNGKWRMCIDFTDLNKACFKDSYPLPRIDALIDSTSGCELMSFLDAFQGYNQICLARDDQEKTSFVTDQGIFCYNVMPFGLKNAGATYQRLVNNMFREQIGRNMEVYIDDMMEVQRLTGRLATLNRFISRSSDRGLPFFKVLKKREKFQWTPQCQEAFEKLKEYLASPPLLTKPKDEETLYLYLATSQGAISAVLTREEGRDHQPIYYVSKTLQGAEEKYPPIEKLAFALVVTARRLRPYFQSHPIVVLTNHPLKRVLAEPNISGRMVKWAVELSEYGIEYHPRPAIKAQALVDFVVEMTAEESEHKEQWWKLFVAWVIHLARKRSRCDTENPPSAKSKDNLIDTRILRDRRSANEILVTTSKPCWKDTIEAYLTMGSLPADRKEARTIRTRATRFTMIRGELYKRGFSQPYLKCLDPERAEYVLKEIHEESCGNHSGGRSLAGKILRQGYFWPSIQKDAMDMVRCCQKCQEHVNITHTPAALMQPIANPCPFDQWGMDLVGKLPRATG
ncbi:UNVERIFIED_CONTAM: Transposon Ty3-G Gag-Pol polyprotein [Sesamum calycinum]|uniref:Transposon Ty3-G Gag-Pol polyprotein n=1 Tax=Sesamum calycinum TaxID=2727403 RepID=A0AAW2SVN4_9LAMI